MSHQVVVITGKQHIYRCRGMWRIDWRAAGWSTLCNTIRDAQRKGEYWYSIEGES